MLTAESVTATAYVFVATIKPKAGRKEIVSCRVHERTECVTEAAHAGLEKSIRCCALLPECELNGLRKVVFLYIRRIFQVSNGPGNAYRLYRPSHGELL